MLLSLLTCACAHVDPAPLIETCLLNTADKDPEKWSSQCELKVAPDPQNPTKRSVDRSLQEMDKYFCTNPDDIKLLLNRVHQK